MHLDYVVLPNYWNGYAPADERAGGKLAFGELAIRRSHAEDDRYQYQVVYTNEASGEELHLSYRTKADAFRSLLGEWTVQTTNHAGDLYRSINITGTFRDVAQRRDIELTIDQRLAFIAARIGIERRITCTWSLFDCLRDLADQQGGEINLLEDLEKLKPACRLTFYEEALLAVEDKLLRLRGYVLQGPGEAPSYWWLDDDGRVAIMSNVFTTFVLRGANQ